MSDDPPPPEEPGSEFDRMSLNSLRRELEVQQAKTEQAREDAQDRIREGREKKVPWAKIIIACVVGAVLIGGVIVLLRTELVHFEAWSPPEPGDPDWDAGPEPEQIEYFPDAGHDAGVDAGRRHHGRRHGNAQPAEDGEENPAGGFQFNDSDDPLEGINPD